MRILIALIAVLSVFPAQAALDWETALNGEQRSAEHQQRDQYRHPRETLEFFGLRDNMTVVEISPGGGWYTEILAPLVTSQGKLYAAHYALNPGHPYYRRSLGKYLLKLGESKDLYSKVIVTQLQPPYATESAPAGTADMAVTFRNVHNWMSQGNAKELLAALFKSLKSGGTLGVVEHRAKPDTSIEAMIESGYVTQDHVISMVEAAGFKFIQSSEINANSKDSASHPEGVWTLPPSLRLGDKKRDHYLAIGESDRMTLKFFKP